MSKVTYLQMQLYKAIFKTPYMLLKTLMILERGQSCNATDSWNDQQMFSARTLCRSLGVTCYPPVLSSEISPAPLKLSKIPVCLRVALRAGPDVSWPLLICFVQVITL